MKTLSPVSAREAVHLLVLGKLVEMRADTLWVLKGGVNLRLFFESPRYSEDMDLDAGEEGAAAVRSCIKGVFHERAFLRRLQRLGIRGLDPGQGPNKDTQTTFRYKFRIVMPGDVHLPTKVEVSFRGGHMQDPFEHGTPNAAITSPYELDPIIVPHYTRTGAIRQKIGALAGRTLVQARDIFDLHVLVGDAPENRLVRHLADSVAIEELRTGYDRALEVTFDHYRGQVLEFLEPTFASVCGTQSAWDEIRLQAASLLERVIMRQEKPR